MQKSVQEYLCLFSFVEDGPLKNTHINETERHNYTSLKSLASC